MATLAPFTFRIHFSGLCFFNTAKLISAGSNAANTDLGTVDVLLPNLLQPLPLPQPPVPPGGTPPPLSVLEPHFPLLELNPANLYDGPLPANRVRREVDFTSNTRDHRGQSCCLLLGEALSIRIDDQEPPQAGVQAPPFSKASPHSLYWVATLSSVFDNNPPQLKSGTDLAPAPGIKPSVITSIELTQGNLSTTDRTPDNFKVNGVPNFDQPIALELTWEVQGVKDRVVIEAKRNDGGISHLVLVPDPQDTLRGPVDIHIQNREINSFIGIPGLDKTYQSPSGKFDFMVYRGLMQGDPGPIFPVSSGASPQAFATNHLGSCPPSSK